MKPGRAALLSLMILVLGAGRALAAPVLGAAKPWHYWISFLLMASFVLLVLALVVGYVWRVVLVRYGFRSEKQ